MSDDFSSDFNAAEVEPSKPIDVVPPGKYLSQAIIGTYGPNNKDTGKIANFEFEILDGEFKGRHFWDSFNIVNQSAEAQRIAQQKFSAFCHACNKITAKKPDDLLFIPFVAQLKVRPAGLDKSGIMRNARNEVSGYLEASGQLPATAQQPAARQAAAAQRQATPAAAQSAAIPPWKRKI